ncbi:hypothetical protein D9611_004113 [Ephemerocybe angulata]|uniref:Uncharacterized protein n=1 Tax=Ephemerocybe angulata TaxID=980116 RepID=A0A8H5BKR4_9AGAR|nr:hypothetical protein D9611_004113 [Tulosesus angulatus]
MPSEADAATISSWIGHGKVYKDVPDCVSDEVKARISFTTMDTEFCLQKIYQQIPQQRHFRSVWQNRVAVLNLPRFWHIPSLHWLVRIPPAKLQVLSDGSKIIMDTEYFASVFTNYFNQRGAIITAITRFTALSKAAKNSEGDEDQL